MVKFVKYRLVCWFYSKGLVKACNCLKDDLLSPKLQAYGFS